MTAFVVVWVGLFGLIVGSFLTVVAHRVPKGESVVLPRSRCPGCGTMVAPRDNIPVFSWLLLRGKCRHCGEPISVRYPLVELSTGLLFVGVALRLTHTHHGTRLIPSYLVLSGALIALTLIDLETLRLPDVITLPLYPAGLLLLVLPAALSGDGHAALRAVEGGALLYAVYFALCFATAGRGLGFGDVKLAGPLGLHLAFLGWKVLAVGVLACHVVAGVVAVGLVLRGSAGRRTRVPFGPFLVAGTFIGILAGQPLGKLWLRG